MKDNINGSKMSNNILEVKSVQSNNLKILFKALKEVLLTDINLIFTKEAIKVIEVDGNKKAMVHLSLNSEAFEYYFCDKEEIIVGINSTNIYKIIEICNNNDVISFCINKEEEDYLYINMENSIDNKIFTSKVKILNLGSNHIRNIPDITFDCEITIPSSKFQKYMKNLNSLGVDNNLEIISIDKKLVFSCSGDFSNNKIILGGSENVVFDKHNQDTIQGVFPLKFIILFTKASNLCKTLQLYLKNDAPLILKYNVGNLGDLKFVLSPVF